MFGIGKRDKNMNPDLYQIQRAKEDYVLVHDHFTANPELFSDTDPEEAIRMLQEEAAGGSTAGLYYYIEGGFR